MSCAASGVVNKFVITRGVVNTFFFTIKANGSTLPITISESDTFTAVFRLLETDTTALTKALTVENADNGKVKLVISPSEANEMQKLRGGKEDRYYLSPTYSLTLLCNTAANGEFIARVPHVYVD